MFQRMRSAASQLLTKIHHHPFNVQLHAGTLPRRYFEEYVREDVYYLSSLHQALIKTAERMSNQEHADTINLLANKTLRSEQTMMAKYLSFQSHRLFVPPAKNKVIDAYVAHLRHHAYNQPTEVALAAILACFDTYRGLGVAMAKTPLSPAHPYLKWINSYSKPEFVMSVDTMGKTVDQLGADSVNQNEMIQAFVTSVEFELKFWDSILPTKPSSINTLSLAG